jgi:hypothetical protein
LWIKGHAGTGKTMLLIGIIRELSGQPAKLTPDLSYFLCQGTGPKELNTATATLRSLIWMLLLQQPDLIEHLRSEYEYSGASLFTDEDAFSALSSAFEGMLKDPQLSSVYFIVDALDECDEGLETLVRLISTSLKLSDRVKWLVSSRPQIDVLDALKSTGIRASLVELNAQTQEMPVKAYIKHKLLTLEGRDGYNGSILTKMSNEILQRAEKTFLWVALVFKELDAKDINLKFRNGAYALQTLEAIPSGLSELYGFIMTRIERGLKPDPQYCKDVLRATVLVYRPLSFSELAILTGLPPAIEPRTIVEKCGSFLITTGNTVNLIHQSAKDYLVSPDRPDIFPSPEIGHRDLAVRSLTALNVLKRDLCGINDYGPLSSDVKAKIDLKPVEPFAYSSCYWIDHLCTLNAISGGQTLLIDDIEILRFLQNDFLHWLECLSILGKISDAVGMIRKLRDLAIVWMTSFYISQS